MTPVIIIPARLGSTRFPRKMLANDTGMPLVMHACERARATGYDRVVIATEDQEIADACPGVESVLTGSHPNGTSRLAEAAAKLGLAPDQVIVNVQGDEPEVEPDVIRAAVEALVDSDGAAAMGTVASPFQPGENPDSPELVKVVLAQDQSAIYFSRARIPFPRQEGPAPLKHIGIYVYTRAFLDHYVSLDPTPLEVTESLEQLRALERGFRIRVAIRNVTSGGIDTPEQYRAFVERERRRQES
ncbi:MAG: 3-deoxy-manno-octulosonate cytidylyltransferase [Phycisphaerales bacterium]|nr:3-deoxy-manno-octulosonate cytidylyltransferase [Phycisphaerales bacterium]